MRLGSVVAFGIVAGALTSCGVSSGEVVRKEYEEPYQIMRLQPTGNGTNVPVWDYYPECWRLDLRDGDDTGSVCVPSNVWQETKIGQEYKES